MGDQLFELPGEIHCDRAEIPDPIHVTPEQGIVFVPAIMNVATEALRKRAGFRLNLTADDDGNLVSCDVALYWGPH